MVLLAGLLDRLLDRLPGRLLGRRSTGALAVALLLVGAASSACGAAGEANPVKIGPQGVDELVIPTPDPDPRDFVAAVDHPFLPLAPGTVWTYDVTGSIVRHLEVRVEIRQGVVAGISCVVVNTTGTDADGDVVLRGSASYAQDTRGNVWLFADQTRALVPALSDLTRSWSADEPGSEAGIAMLASPRVGDGYTRALSAGTTDRSTVLDLDARLTVPAGTFGAMVLVEDVLGVGGDDPPVVQRAYAEGVGLVEQVGDATGVLHLALAEVRAAPG